MLFGQSVHISLWQCPGCCSEEGDALGRWSREKPPHGCPVEETTFLPDLNIFNNSHDSRSWGLLQPLGITRPTLAGLAKVCIALKCPAIKSRSPSAWLGGSRLLGTARSPEQSTAAAWRKKRNRLFLAAKHLFCSSFAEMG